MTILGFRGTHPLMLLFFPAALAVIFGGFWMLRRHRRTAGRAAMLGFPILWCCLALASAAGMVWVQSHAKYILLYYAGVLAAFVVLDLCLAAFLAAGNGGAVEHSPSRRRFLAGGSVAAAGSLVFLAGADALAGDSPGVEERLLHLERSPQAASGRELRISLVSDLHAGFFLPKSTMDEALARVADFKPDVVFFGGDLIERETSFLAETTDFFRDLTKMAPVYGVLGNHDNYVDSGVVAGFLTDTGVSVLRGTSARLDGPWGRFTVCGLRDMIEPGVSFKPLRGLPLASTIMLAHNPRMGLALPQARSPWLTLSGHTHGGQICLPGVGPLVNQADRRIRAGVNDLDGRRIVVSAGLGYSGLPVRLFCPPDVTNIVVS